MPSGRKTSGVTIAMALERTQTTWQSESSKLNHWAWLRSYPGAMRPASGRYYIPEAVHADWSGRKPGAVPIAVAAGLLGAEVVTGFGPAK